MARYFFHLIIGSRVEEDAVGTEFLSLEAAVADARQARLEIMRDEALDGCRIVISDKDGHVFTTLPQPDN
jgi:hypothetical protein